MNRIGGLMLGLLVLAFSPAAQAATFVVNSTADGKDANPGDGVCETAAGNGVCTLRAAVEETNALPGSDTIVVPAGTYVLSSSFSSPNSPHLVMSDGLTVTGAGAATTIIDGHGPGPAPLLSSGVIRFTGPIEATMSGLTVRNGSGGFGSNNPNDTGGITNNGASVTLSAVVISNNTSLCGLGGGILNKSGTLTLTDSTVSGNSVPKLCLGVPLGGGIYNAGTMTVSNVTISNNSAVATGAGLANVGTMTLTNVTFTGNSSGAIYNLTTMDLNNVTVVGAIFNASAAAINLRNTLIANDPSGSTCQGTLNSLGHNLIQPSCYTITGDSTGNILGQDPLLAPLANNGGPTSTHALLPGSPAIDAGDNATCAATDQRGATRPQDGNGDHVAICDIGAYEVRANALVAAVLPGSRSVTVGTPATTFLTIINAGTSTASQVGIALNSAIPASLDFRTTDPATNQVTGTLNAPVDIAAGTSQTFVVGITPTAVFSPADVAFTLAGTDTDPVAPLVGVNTFLLSASTVATPDIVAVSATIHNDGIVDVPGPTGTGVFAVATFNAGIGGTLTVSADTGDATLPVSLWLCQTDPTTGVCLSPSSGSSVTTSISANGTPTFAVFVTGSGSVPFDPARNRIFLRLKDAGAVTRGQTSVAVRTQ